MESLPLVVIDRCIGDGLHGKWWVIYSQVAQFRSVAQSCLTLCDPMNCSTPGIPAHHRFPEFIQTHVH